ncbi:MAG: hypothetical protein V3U27_14365, partial [Candidatus Tectomicrobia bacterium]
SEPGVKKDDACIIAYFCPEAMAYHHARRIDLARQNTVATISRHHDAAGGGKYNSKLGKPGKNDTIMSWRRESSIADAILCS